MRERVILLQTYINNAREVHDNIYYTGVKMLKVEEMESNPRKQVRYTFSVHFTSLEEKETFQRRLKGIQELLTPSGCPSIDNHTLMNAFMDAIEAKTPIVTERNSPPVTKSFMRNGGSLY